MTVLIFVFLGFLYHLTTRIIFKVQKFGINDSLEASLIYYNNISTNIDLYGSKSLTDSLKIRLNQVVSEDNETYDESLEQYPPYTGEYREFLREHIGRFPFIELSSQDDKLHVLSIMNEVIENVVMTTFTSLSYSEKNILNKISSKRSPEVDLWKIEYSQLFLGIVEAYNYNNAKNLLAIVVFREDLNERKLHFITLQDLKLEDLQSLNSDYTKDKFSYPSIQEFDLNVTHSITNIAVSETMIAFTTKSDNEHLSIYCIDEDTNQWVLKKQRFHDTFRRIKLHQNLGLHFIPNSPKQELRLLVIDIVATEQETLHLSYSVYKFLPNGDSVYRTRFNDTHLREMAGVSSGMVDLFKIGLSQDFHEFCPFKP